MNITEHDEYRVLTKAPSKRTFLWVSWPGAGPWSTRESAQNSIDKQINSLAQGYQFRIQHRRVTTQATEWANL